MAVLSSDHFVGCFAETYADNALVTYLKRHGIKEPNSHPRPASPSRSLPHPHRHKSLNVAQKYARNVDQLRRAVSNYPLLAT
jgi:hypothetical protein